MLFYGNLEARTHSGPLGPLPETGPTADRISETDEIIIYRAGRLQGEKRAIALLDPVLFAPNILFREDGLVESLLDDYNVYLLMWKRPADSPDASLISTELEKAISLLRTDCACNDFIAGGLSMGGQRWLPYLNRLEETGDTDSRGNRLHSIFFLGTGLDYSYPGSLYRKQWHLRVKQNLEQNCQGLNQPCMNFISTSHFRRGLKLRHIPAPVVPDDLGAVRMFPVIEKMSVPVAFIYGKIDSLSPEESIYPVFRAWGRKGFLWQIRQNHSPYSTDNPVFWLEGSEANRIRDYDHFDLFLHPDADDEIYDELVDWFQDAERKPDN